MDSYLQTLADANLVESIREHARWQPGSECVEEDGLLISAGTTRFPFPYLNCLIRVDPSVSAQRVLDQARDFFWTRSRGFVLFVRASQDQDLDSLCQEKGLKLLGDAPCMVVEKPFKSVDSPDDVRVESVTVERHVRDSVSINREAYQVYGFDPQAVDLLYGEPSRLLSSANVTGYVLYRENRPVSTALTILSGNGAGIYWVGTVSAAQRSGLGTIGTKLATNAGFQHDASVVTLQASPHGEPVYARLGFKTYDRLRFYVHPKPSAVESPF